MRSFDSLTTLPQRASTFKTSRFVSDGLAGIGLVFLVAFGVACGSVSATQKGVTPVAVVFPTATGVSLTRPASIARNAPSATIMPSSASVAVLPVSTPTAQPRISTASSVPLKVSPSPDTWQQLSGDIRDVRVIRVVPGDVQTVYAAGATVLRSTDGGKHWRTLLSGINAEDLAIGVGGNVLLVGQRLACGRGTLAPFYRSADGGATWERNAKVMIGRLAGDPASPGRFFATTCGGLLRSNDAGQTWERLKLPLSGYDGMAIAVTPNGREVFGALVSEGGTARLVRSTDGGNSFSLLTGVDLFGAVSLTTRGPGQISAVASRGAFASTDDGVTWTPLERGLAAVQKVANPARAVLGTMAVNPLSPSGLYLATPNGLSVYEAGVGWRIDGGLKGPVTAFDIGRTPNGIVIDVGTNTGIYRQDVQGQRA